MYIFVNLNFPIFESFDISIHTLSKGAVASFRNGTAALIPRISFLSAWIIIPFSFTFVLVSDPKFSVCVRVCSRVCMFEYVYV